MREDIYITSHKFGKEFYISVEDFKNTVNEIQNKYRALEKENKKLKKRVIELEKEREFLLDAHSVSAE